MSRVHCSYWRRFASLCAALTGVAVSCREYGTGVAPDGRVRLSILYSPAIAGESLDLGVFFLRADQTEASLLSRQDPLVPGISVIPVTVDISECLDSGAGEERATSCPLRIRLVLRSALGTAVDSQVIGPLNASPGQTITPSQVTLQRVNAIVLTAGRDTIAVLDTTSMAYQLLDPSGAPIFGKTVLWRSQTPAIASVSVAGRVLGLAPGAALIQARAANDTTVSATRSITVRGVIGVALAPDSAEIDVGQTLNSIPVVTVFGGVPTTVIWLSTLPGITTVNANGLITAVGPGRAVVRAVSTADTTKKDSIVVNVAGVQATAALHTLARQAFASAMDGKGNSLEGQILVSGMVADEWFDSETFPQRIEYDRREITTTNTILAQVFQSLQDARLAANRELTALVRFGTGAATDPRFSTAHNINGAVLLTAAMNYCSGIPFADDVLGLPKYGAQMTTSGMLQAAIAHFDSALAGAPGAANVELNTARLLKARALLVQGQFAAAAAQAATVPTSFRALNAHGPLPTNENTIFHLNRNFKRWSLSHAEGGAGLPFRGGSGTVPTAADPRLPWVAQGLGFNLISPSFGWLGVNTPLDSQAFAKGQEARLIEAEANLQANNIAAFLAQLNALRSTVPLPAVTDPGTQQARIDLLFAERGFWLFGTGTRLADLRRLMRQYGRSQAVVFPTGPYTAQPSQPAYGADVTLPLPAGFITGSCFDRNP